MDRIEAAVQNFKEGKSCSQAVFIAFSDKFGIDKQKAIMLSAGFGGGMGMGETCGAVTGAFMALGLTFDSNDPDAKDKMHALTREFADRFKLHAGALDCRDLLGCEISTAEGKDYAKKHDLRATVCEKLVRIAAEITDELLRRAGK